MKTFDFNETKTRRSTCDFFTKVDRVLSGEVKIQVTHSSGSGSRTNLRTKEIIIDFNEARHSDVKRNFAVLKGLNYHELAHQELTVIDMRIDNASLAGVMNGLEDGRIETIYSRKYPKTQEYFEATFLSVLWKHRKKTAPEQFLSVYSRRLILDAKYIAVYELIFREKYGDEVTDKVKKLIDEYVGCTDADRLYQIGFEVEKLIHDKEKLGSDPLINRGRIETPSGNKKSSEETKSICEQFKEELEDTQNDFEEELDDETIEKVKEKIKEAKQKQKNVEQKEKESLEADRKVSELKDKKLQKLRDKLNAKTQKEKDDLQKEIEDIENKLSDARKKSEEKYQEKCDAKREQNDVDLSDVIDKDIEEQIEINIDIKEEEIEREISIIAGKKGKEIEYETELTNIQPQTKMLSRDLENIFKVLKNDNKRGNVTGLKTGNINIKRAMNFKHTGDLNIFQKTLPDYHKKQRMGIIILIDTSGSMHGARINNVTQGAWAVKEALSNTENKVAVIGYNSYHTIIKGFNDNGDFASINAGGGTNPNGALACTKDLIKKEPSIKNWLVIIMTDGEWCGNNQQAEKQIEEINKMNSNIETILVSVSTTQSGKACKHRYEIHEVEDLRKIFVELVNKTRHTINNNIKKGVA